MTEFKSVVFAGLLVAASIGLSACADGGGTQCGPVCEIYCQYGNVKDASGCPTCACNPPPTLCQANECGATDLIAMLCPDGSAAGQSCVRGANGACSWVWNECPAMCEPVTCKIF